MVCPLAPSSMLGLTHDVDARERQEVRTVHGGVGDVDEDAERVYLRDQLVAVRFFVASVLPRLNSDRCLRRGRFRLRDGEGLCP